MGGQNWQGWLERLETPLGELLLITDAAGQVRALDWQDHEARMHRLLARQYRGQNPDIRPGTAPSVASKAVQSYFEGRLDALEALPVAWGGTDFQRQVWAALRTVPVGATVTYGELARSIDRPRAVRAVGLANGANPIGLIVPCHRVIGRDGTLTGYAGGLERKRWLLRHEQAATLGGDVSGQGRLWRDRD